MAQEFDLPITLNKGLRPDPRVGRGFAREFLHEVNRFTPREFGLRPSALTVPSLNPALTTLFPYPQVFKMHDQRIILDETDAYLVDDSGSPWALTLQSLFDFDTRVAGATITTGDYAWDGTLDQENGVFTNGQSVVVFDKEGLLTGQANQVFVSDKRVASICYHQGRVIYGGINPADLWTDSWKAIFEEWILASQAKIDYESADEIEANFLFWSGIRNGTDLWPLQSPDATDWREIFRSQQAGFMPMPTGGSILRVLPLGGGLVIYTTDAIYSAQPLQVDAMLAYGIRQLGSIGVLGKGAVGGTDSEHVFADERGDLWRISGNLQPAKLGFREFVGNFSDTVQISFDPLEEEYWIAGGVDGDASANGTNCYILSRQGLGHARQHPTSLHVIDGELFGLIGTVGTDAEFRIATEIVDFGVRDFKTITTVEVGLASASSLTDDPLMVAVDYSYTNQSSFVRSAWVPVNEQGFARIQITAVEFRVLVKWDIGSETAPELDYLKVRWQRSGNRTTRGVTSAAETV